MRRLDVISQGREPKRDFRLPLSLPRRWRIVGGVAAVLVVAAVLTVALRPRHVHVVKVPSTGVPGAAALTPGLPTGGFGPGNRRSFVVCVPPTGACSVRVIIVGGVASRMTKSKLR